MSHEPKRRKRRTGRAVSESSVCGRGKRRKKKIAEIPIRDFGFTYRLFARTGSGSAFLTCAYLARVPLGAGSATAVAVAAVAVSRREQGRERAVLIEAIQKRENDRQAAAAEKTFAEHSVFRPEHEQSDENPKSGVTLCTAIHKMKPPVFLPQGICRKVFLRVCAMPAVLSFYYILLSREKKCYEILFLFFPLILLPTGGK